MSYTRVFQDDIWDNSRSANVSLRNGTSRSMEAAVNASCTTSASDTRPASLIRDEKLLFEQQEATRPQPGIWQKQMFVDRTLRFMATITALFAILATAALVSLAPRLNNMNGVSTSVPVAFGSRTSLNLRCGALKFFINVVATMVLSMSNTYQQLLTAPSISDLRHILTKYGDSRVATNSPFAIRHKRHHRARSLCCWTLLICTSVPIHLLANSIVGVTAYHNFKHSGVNLIPIVDHRATKDIADKPCWPTMVQNKRTLEFSWENIRSASKTIDYQNYWGDLSCEVIKKANRTLPDSSCSDMVDVYFDSKQCGDYANAPESQSILNEANYECFDDCSAGDVVPGSNRWLCRNEKIPILGNCTKFDFSCNEDSYYDCAEVSHALVVRISATGILVGCLVFKAVYMIAVNYLARTRIKHQCLTFGDVIVASIIENVRVNGESMINGGDFHRRDVTHECHKHCKPETSSSSTGDDLGHCQKCTRFNSFKHLTNLPWPTVSTKQKKSLIENLGQTVVSQLLILNVCSTAMVVASVVLAFQYTNIYAAQVCAGITTYSKEFFSPQAFKNMYGHGLRSEFAAFCISNGCQLIYSALYILLFYNATLISMERDWGKLEKERVRLRCTIVKGESFVESYFLQLPKRFILPITAYSIVMHWLLGLAVYTEEVIATNGTVSLSRYDIITIPVCVWASNAFLLALTAGCWWAFTYSREGFIPQMYGSIRTLCSATSMLHEFPVEGIHWGDLTDEATMNNWRHAGLSGGEVRKIVPNELYA